MRRDYFDLGFTLLLLALIGWTTFEARQWDARARLFPWAAGIPVLVLLVIQLIRQIRTMVTSPDGAALFVDANVEPRVAAQRTLQIAGWILGFAAFIWAMGFSIGGTLATLVYLKTSSREKWPVSIAITVGVGAFFWLLSTQLHVPFPRGFIVDQLPI